MPPLSTDNPFADPPSPVGDRSREISFTADSTLSVGRNASLTLGTDSLVVLDENFGKGNSSNCCGLLPSSTANTRAIPLHNILWAELIENELAIQHASLYAKEKVRPETLSYQIDNATLEATRKFVSKLLDRAYGNAKRQKRARVLVNPHAGKGSADKWYHRDVEPLLKASKCIFDTVYTKYQGEAVKIAESINVDAYDMVVSCSGDGLPHEVFNGLGKRKDAKKALSKIAVVQIPCGSGNALSLNLNATSSPSLATLAIIKGIPMAMDLVSVTQGETRTLSFLSQSFGIVAEVDLGTENMRWIGSSRFPLGYLARVMRKAIYPCDIAVKVALDDKPSIREHYRKELDNHEGVSERRGYKNLLDDDASASSGVGDGLPTLRYGTANGKLPEGWEMVPYDKLVNFYCGNMAYMTADSNFFPAALPSDGYMDLLCVNGDISRISSIKMMLNLQNNKLFSEPLVWYRKIYGYRIIPKQKGEGYISVDGERIPFGPLQAEIHKGLGTVLSKTGHLYEAPGPL